MAPPASSAQPSAPALQGSAPSSSPAHFLAPPFNPGPAPSPGPLAPSNSPTVATTLDAGALPPTPPPRPSQVSGGGGGVVAAAVRPEAPAYPPWAAPPAGGKVGGRSLRPRRGRPPERLAVWAWTPVRGSPGRAGLEPCTLQPRVGPGIGAPGRLDTLRAGELGEPGGSRCPGRAAWAPVRRSQRPGHRTCPEGLPGPAACSLSLARPQPHFPGGNARGRPASRRLRAAPEPGPPPLAPGTPTTDSWETPSSAGSPDGKDEEARGW